MINEISYVKYKINADEMSDFVDKLQKNFI